MDFRRPASFKLATFETFLTALQKNRFSFSFSLHRLCCTWPCTPRICATCTLHGSKLDSSSIDFASNLKVSSPWFEDFDISNQFSVIPVAATTKPRQSLLGYFEMKNLDHPPWSHQKDDFGTWFMVICKRFQRSSTNLIPEVWKDSTNLEDLN